MDTLTNTGQSLRSPYLKQTLDAIESAIYGMTDEQMIWAPQERWSAVLILEHLSLTYYRTIQGAKSALRQAGPPVRRPTLRERAILRLFFISKRFPKHLRAPRMVVPRGMGPEQAKQSIITNLIQMDAAMQECNAMFGRNMPCFLHGVAGPLTVRQCCHFHLLHTRHHMKQVQRLRRGLVQSRAADRMQAAVS